ncbi:DUF262 domain-containing protein [Lysobacter sp. LF1]|uniref:DUF262 domain-containing protein n=1 Tax=Lysobacter stagni TaxID=3045172 RepID=A0ABT6XKT6_9GAMM|nr:DUF262 domain-containing protein [Lysobacter sp. LF1]MDI9240774.1 DUF262 domain-containing protein [Lysobacter sp. LF1]
MTELTEFEDEDDTEIESAEVRHFSDAVLHSADWTVETLVSQLTRQNIEMSPRFQRRDAWSVTRKSAFIESLVLGLPVPQIVLAEKQGQRGKYIVLDGKQRLLSLMQFTGNAAGEHNAFRLRGLEARSDLARKTYEQLNDPAYENDLNAFHNYTVRTVVIRNWPNYDFLHLVFLRLNTGSVKLSPQELRQAMFPGDFSNEVDDQAGQSQPLQTLLGRDSPDPRMRDVELLVRYLGFNLFLPEYAGRMKDFLDLTCERLNAAWSSRRDEICEAMHAFDAATAALIDIFGADGVARKEGSRSFNRAIFDALVFYAANPVVRQRMLDHRDRVRTAYQMVIAQGDFLNAAESDTAGVPNTYARLHLWGKALSEAIEAALNLPTLRPARTTAEKAGIDFAGLGV